MITLTGIGARICAGLATVTIAFAQAPPPPGAQFQPGLPPPPPPSTGPQLAGCTGPDGKLLQISPDLNATAQATGPFSIQLTWSGPPAEYRITATDVDVVVTTTAQLQIGDAVGAKIGRTGAIFKAPQSTTAANGSFQFSRPQFSVLPNFSYGFKLQATLADGRIVCTRAGANTPAAPILPLQAAFVAPDDIRLALQVPPYVQEFNVYRENYTDDGRVAPGRRLVLREGPQDPAGGSTTKRVAPGLPPLPSNYNYSQPGIYDFVVEAVWQDGRGRSSRTLTSPIRVSAPPLLVGWADLHTHPMSHLAFGGKIFHGAPDAGSLLPSLSIPTKTPLGRNDCLVQPNLRAANIDQALADDSATHGDPVQSVCGDVIRKAVIVGMELNKGLPQPGRRMGAPVFDAWPAWNDIAHQKMWVEWIRRAHQGGLRVMVALSHNNRLLADLARGNCSDSARPCLRTDDQASSDLQIGELRAFASRNSDFMEVALSSADVYRIVRANKIAIVLGVEIDNIGNFSVRQPPSQKQVADELARLYAQGVRYIFPIHVTDNVFGGTAPYNNMFNAANLYETGNFWDVECAGAQPYPNDEIGFATPNVTVLDEIPYPFNSFIPKDVPVPKSPQNCIAGAGHRNRKGLSPQVGAFAIKEMMRLGFIIDVDHMSHRTVQDVLSIAESVPGGGYPLMSGHNGIRNLGLPNDPASRRFNTENSRTREQLDRIGCLGGMFGLGADHAEARVWARQYHDALQVIRHRSTRCLHKDIGLGAVALGTDINSLVQTPKPLAESGVPSDPDRQANIYTSVVGTSTRFPFGPASTGGKTWDFRTHGVAHYGMFADFIKAVWAFPRDANRGLQISGQELVEGHLDRSADNFWRMWVKVDQQKNQVKH